MSETNIKMIDRLQMPNFTQVLNYLSFCIKSMEYLIAQRQNFYPYLLQHLLDNNTCNKIIKYARGASRNFVQISILHIFN